MVIYITVLPKTKLAFRVSTVALGIPAHIFIANTPSFTWQKVSSEFLCWINLRLVWFQDVWKNGKHEEERQEAKAVIFSQSKRYISLLQQEVCCGCTKRSSHSNGTSPSPPSQKNYGMLSPEYFAFVLLLHPRKGAIILRPFRHLVKYAAKFLSHF